jgi:hypothetical protein
MRWFVKGLKMATHKTAESGRPAAPMAELRLTFDELGPDLISVTLNCQHPECSNNAGSISVVRKGKPHPDDKFLQRDLLDSLFGDVRGVIIVKGFLDNFNTPLCGEGYEQAAEALRSGDFGALHALGKEYTPFYCRRCPGVFCEDHFNLNAVWDEAGLDYWFGKCPYGHGHMINH